MILAQRKDDGSYMVINGAIRLMALLQENGKVEVLDIDSGEPVHVYEVDGKLLAISDDNHSNLEDLTNFAINKVRR